MFMDPQRRIAALMTAIVPQSDVFPEATVRRLVDDLEAIPDHRDRRVRVHPLASLLAIHVLAAVGDANGPEDAADFARDHAAWLRGLGLLGARIPSAQTLRRVALNILTLLQQYFWPKLSIRRLRKMVARNPRPAGAAHGPVTTLSTP